MKLEFSGIDLEVTPTGDERQWYTTVEEAARAFGVARDSIKMNLSKHQDEIRHGIEIENTIDTYIDHDGFEIPRERTVIYLKGLIKLSFFMRGARAKDLRTFVTNLIINGIDSTGNNTPEAFTGLMDRLSDFDNKLEKLSNNLSRKIDKLNCVTTDEGE